MDWIALTGLIDTEMKGFLIKRGYFLIQIVTLCACFLTASHQIPSTHASQEKIQSTQSTRTAPELLRRAMTAMGGEEKLAGLKSVKLTGEVIVNRLDDSERNEPPWWVSIQEINEYRDLIGERQSQEIRQRTPQFRESTILTPSADGIFAQGFRQGDRLTWQGSVSQQDWFRLSPERILFTAAKAADLKVAPETLIHGVDHHVLSFTWQSFPIKIFINAESWLPDCVESIRTNKFDLVQSAWGDVKWRTEFLFWRLDKSGIFYPRQWNTFRNDEPIRTSVFTDVEFNADLPTDAFVVPDEAKKQFESVGKIPFADRPLRQPEDPIKQIASGIGIVAGNWNVGILQQSDGIVILECPQSGGYSQKIIQAVQKHFPNAPIKAVISTTDSLWHFAGLREYVARGIPIYALGRNVPLLQRFVAASHTFEPDTLAQTPRAADIRPVTGKMVIGDGPTKLVIAPIQGQADERMLMVYFPEQHILYGSSNDLYPDAKGVLTMTFNFPELVRATVREKLSIEKIFAIHTELMLWDEAMKVLMRESPSFAASLVSAGGGRGGN